MEAAVLAGKAVFCEKPVDLSSDRIRSCLKAVKAAAILLMIGFNRRFDPHFSALRAHLRNGDIGELELLTITGRDPAPPPVSYVKRSGGIFRDKTIHDFDMARFLLEEEFVEILAIGSALIDGEIGKAGDGDTAALMLKTASGKIGQISNSRRSTYGYDQRVEVHGSRGMLQVQNIPETMISYAGTIGVQKGPYVEFFLERYAIAYERELQHFFDCIREGRSPNPTGEDGLRAQLIADAATIASQTGQPQQLWE
ncbi:Gfo/Idh/MocA family oxidoreductase (plasmid) [Agrobacterium arsenijevicii]|uniref:Gfo/Idh/MocA family protein n=1 Tax=Agrobacterium arsenijevicii TaxID=1585697 RepID=UPI001FCDF8B3|nr:Gfo/Idh/MocA family oxidoreductase [Agrobacterium fabrum]